MAVLLFFLLCAPSSVQVRVTFFSTLWPFALSHFAKRERHRRRCRGYMRAPGPGGGVPMQNGTAAPPQLDVFCLFFYLYWFLFSSLPRFLLFLKISVFFSFPRLVPAFYSCFSFPCSLCCFPALLLLVALSSLETGRFFFVCCSGARAAFARRGTAVAVTAWPSHATVWLSRAKHEARARAAVRAPHTQPWNVRSW